MPNVMRKKLKAGLTMRILVDSSTLIALSKIGELDILKKVFGNITITNAIEKEVLTGDFPETEALKVAMGAWIEVIDYAGILASYGNMVWDVAKQAFCWQQSRRIDLYWMKQMPDNM